MTAAAPAQPATEPQAKCDSYTDDLTDRDWAIIYYAMTGLAPPREKWADEALSGLDRGTGAEEAWKRANAQIDTQWNAIKDVRCVTLRTRADPKDYDPGLGGIPLGAFAPDAFYPSATARCRSRSSSATRTRRAYGKCPPTRLRRSRPTAGSAISASSSGPALSLRDPAATAARSRPGCRVRLEALRI